MRYGLYFFLTLSIAATVCCAQDKFDGLSVSGHKEIIPAVYSAVSMLKTRPPHWTIFIIPDSEWSTLAARHLEAMNHRQVFAYSLVTLHLTYVRESTIYRSNIRWVLAHEAGHVLCECLSEKVADTTAKELLGPNP